MIIKRYKLKSSRKKSYDKVITKTLYRLRRLLKKAWEDLEIWRYYADYPSRKTLEEYIIRGEFIHKYDDVIRQIHYIQTLERCIKTEKKYHKGNNVYI